MTTPSHQCVYCSERFYGRASLGEHTRARHSYKCDECALAFPTGDELRAHRSSAHSASSKKRPHADAAAAAEALVSVSRSPSPPSPPSDDDPFSLPEPDAPERPEPLGSAARRTALLATDRAIDTEIAAEHAGAARRTETQRAERAAFDRRAVETYTRLGRAMLSGDNK